MNGADDRLLQLRGLLIGPELEQIEALRRRLDDPEARSEDLSKQHSRGDRAAVQTRPQTADHAAAADRGGAAHLRGARPGDAGHRTVSHHWRGGAQGGGPCVAGPLRFVEPDAGPRLVA